MPRTDAPRRFDGRAMTARLLNGLGVVVAILLAFGIQAWWDGRQEQQRVDALLAALEAEWVGEMDKLDMWIESLDINRKALEALIDAHQRPEGVTADSAAALLQSYLWLIYKPAVTAVNALLETDLDKVHDPELRMAIAAWPSELERATPTADVLSEIGLTDLRAEYARIAASMDASYSVEGGTIPCYGSPLYGRECIPWVSWGVPLGELGLRAIEDPQIAVINRHVSTLLTSYRNSLIDVRGILQEDLEILETR